MYPPPPATREGGRSEMLNFLARRLASALLVLVLVSALSFGIIWLVPGDPTAILLDASATPEQVERLRAQLGLDKPLPLQIVEWYGRILRGDLGQSILLNRSVTAAILERLPVTLVARRHRPRACRRDRRRSPEWSQP